ncbi:hypothetical protein EB822_11190 [Flavobacteriaceae bacterium PRS1]|nr:hypothetical protein EB822_11190 [Flavobacteriaceae bacterium PRS1]
MKVKVKDVKANPYRNIDHYSLNKDKIMALTSSIEKTGFWDNLVGRKMNGEIQIAYGHHRIEALRLAKGYGYDFEFDLPIRDISDGTMIQIMANENMSEWGHSIMVTDETVKVAKDFLENNINFGKFAKASKWKNTKAENGLASGVDISNFLGWDNHKVRESLKRLRLIEDGILSKEAVELFPNDYQANTFTVAVSKTNLTEKEQIKIAKSLDLKKGHKDVKGAVEVAAFEKKYPRGIGKEKKADSRVSNFEHKLIEISEQFDAASLNINALKEMHEEIKNISGIKYHNVRILFISIAELQRHINQFLEVMSKDAELTEENINTLKQLKQ